MEPSHWSGDLLLVGPLRYAEPYPRGVTWSCCATPANPTAHDLKRVVGLPGESVRLADGSLYVDGAHLPEPYLGGLPASVGLECSDWTLADDEFFALSDNRARGNRQPPLRPGAQLRNRGQSLVQGVAATRSGPHRPLALGAGSERQEFANGNSKAPPAGAAGRRDRRQARAARSRRSAAGTFRARGGRAPRLRGRGPAHRIRPEHLPTLHRGAHRQRRAGAPQRPRARSRGRQRLPGGGAVQGSRPAS